MSIRTDIFTIDWDVSPRLIWIDIAYDEVSAQDLYDTCKHLEALDGGKDEDQICDAGGWEPLGLGQYVGITVSLYNAQYAFAARPGPDWVICNMGGGNVVAFTDSTLTTELYPRYPTAYVSADRTASSSATTQEQEAIAYTSFQNAIWYDSASGNSGFDDNGGLNGNRQYPLDNLADVLTACSKWGFSNIQLLSSAVIDGGLDYSLKHFIGSSHVFTDVEITDAANTYRCTFDNCNIWGVLDGGTHIQNCIVGEVSYVNGHIHDSGLYGHIYLDGNEDAAIINCYTLDAESPPTVNMGLSGQNLAMPNYSGYIYIEDITDPDVKVGIGMNSGVVFLDSTISEGYVIVSGTGELVNNATGNSIISTTGLTSNASISEAVWNSILTGATYNIPGSAGRRLRALASAVITDGTAVSSTTNTIELNGDASIVDGAYDPAAIAIVGGTGLGQARLILEYDGATKTAVVDRDWKTQPDNTSEYVITVDAGREHVNEGLALGGDTSTILLNPLASDHDDAYNGQTVFIRSGTGADQACKILTYDGTTKEVTICKPWDIVPDVTSAYVILPTGTMTKGLITSAVWEAEQGVVVRKMLENKVTKEGDVITIYDDDAVSVWRQYNLADGGRVEV